MHRKEIAALLAETLEPYYGFAEVDEIRAIVVAWSQGRVSSLGLAVVPEFREGGETGAVPAIRGIIKTNKNTEQQ